LRHVYAVSRLEPDAVVVDDADDGNRSVEQPGSYGRYAVKGQIGGRIQNVVAADSSQPLRLSHGDLLHLV
jgi:hypothetical protein